MSVRKIRSITAAVLAIFLVASCSTGPAITLEPVDRGMTAEMLLDSSPLATAAEPEVLTHVDLLHVTPGMIKFLERNVDPNSSPNEKLRRLMYAVIGNGQFDLIYDESTRTAEETFRDQQGNCLSFTNLFIAMARHIGLDARYQEVDVPPSWSAMGQALLLSQHVNVLVELDRDSQRIVDFNMADFDFDYDREVITDQRARAHYFSNIGVERMLSGNSGESFSYFSKSLDEDATFSPAWVNLGILYRREGYPDFAEAAYLIALEADHSNLVALSNLSSLYLEQGDSERSEYYLDLVRRHREKNPYYRYQLAQLDFEAGNYDAAIDNLRFAIRARKKEDRFYYLMSTSYLMKGDREEAARWMEKAEAVAVEYADKRKYNRKLEMLMGLD